MEQAFPVIHRQYIFKNHTLALCLPDPVAVQEFYRGGQQGINPYWTAVWPSAEALCLFIAEHPDLFAGREVWEAGAGLALPSLLASNFAGKVFSTELEELAIPFIRQSIRLNSIDNMEAAQADWNRLGQITADLVLLADVNYDPAAFNEVSLMIRRFLDAGCTVFLATPARITSTAFMEFITPYIRTRQLYTVTGKDVIVFTLDRNDNVIKHHGA